MVYELSQPRTVYAQPAPVYVEPQPQVIYVPVGQPARVQDAATQSWYFCAAANGYYPYVRSCPGGWQAVPTTPPGPLTTSPYAPPPP